MDIDTIEIPTGNDPHVHPRDNDEITEEVFRNLEESGVEQIVPIFNYEDPVDAARKLRRERKRIQGFNSRIKIRWSVMFNRSTSPESIKASSDEGAEEFKIITRNSSVNSDLGLTWKELLGKYDCFEVIERVRGRVPVHLEDSKLDATGNQITHPIWREFLPLPIFHQLATDFPGILFIIKHASTRRTLNYFRNKAPKNVGLEICGHYLFRTYSDIYGDSGRKIPGNWCKPCFKFSEDREALIEAATSREKGIFFATDLAPHQDKDPLDPKPGIYTYKMICLLAKLFEERGKLENLGWFFSDSWADFCGLPKNKGRIVLHKKPWIMPEKRRSIEVFEGGEKVEWDIKSIKYA